MTASDVVERHNFLRTEKHPCMESNDKYNYKSFSLTCWEAHLIKILFLMSNNLKYHQVFANEFVKVDKIAIGVCSKNRKCRLTDAQNSRLGGKNKEPFFFLEGGDEEKEKKLGIVVLWQVPKRKTQGRSQLTTRVHEGQASGRLESTVNITQQFPLHKN